MIIIICFYGCKIFKKIKKRFEDKVLLQSLKHSLMLKCPYFLPSGFCDMLTVKDIIKLENEWKIFYSVNAYFPTNNYLL